MGFYIKMNPDGTDGHTGGNTGSARVRSRGWCFTWNNPGNEAQVIETFEAAKAVGYMFQLEQGEHGTFHFQGVVYWDNPREFSMVKQLIPEAHWEKAKNIVKAVAYCQKVETRVEGPWAKLYTINRPLILIKELRLWQQGVVDRVKHSCAEDRKIWWYVDYSGAEGKTTLAKYLVHYYKAVYVSGKATDIKYACMKFMEQHKLGIVIFDFPRTVEGHISYDAIESVKNGLFFSGKYESGMACFNSPHVIIFANFRPDESMLSKDRWMIIELNPRPEEQPLMEWL